MCAAPPGELRRKAAMLLSLHTSLKSRWETCQTQKTYQKQTSFLSPVCPEPAPGTATCFLWPFFVFVHEIKNRFLGSISPQPAPGTTMCFWIWIFSTIWRGEPKLLSSTFRKGATVRSSCWMIFSIWNQKAALNWRNRWYLIKIRNPWVKMYDGQVMMMVWARKW